VIVAKFATLPPSFAMAANSRGVRATSKVGRPAILKKSPPSSSRPARTWHRNASGVTDLDRQLLQASQFQGMVSRSPIMWEVFSHVRRVAPHFQTVLITGETGTGQGQGSWWLEPCHALQPRRPAALRRPATAPPWSESLLETELFGHVKGASHRREPRQAGHV